MSGANLTGIALSASVNMSTLSRGSTYTSKLINFDAVPSGSSGRITFKDCQITGNWPDSIIISYADFDNVEITGTLNNITFGYQGEFSNFDKVTFSSSVTGCLFYNTYPGSKSSLKDVIFSVAVSGCYFAAPGQNASGTEAGSTSLTDVTFVSNVSNCIFAGNGGIGGDNGSGNGGDGGSATMSNVIFRSTVNSCSFAGLDGLNGFDDISPGSPGGKGGKVDLTTTFFGDFVTDTYFYQSLNEAIYDASGKYVKFAKTREDIMVNASTANYFKNSTTDLIDPKYWGNPLPQNNAGSGTGGSTAACFDFHTMQLLTSLLPKRTMRIIGPRFDRSILAFKPMIKSFMWIHDRWEVVSFTLDHPFIIDSQLYTYADLLNIGQHAIPIGEDNDTTMVYNVVIDEPLQLSGSVAMLGASDCNVAHLRQPYINLRLRILDEHGLRYFIRW